MEIILENNFLRVAINTYGAELTSVVNKESGEEMLWNADAEVWPRHAPILFPWCGRLKNNEFTHNGVKYQGGGHGFVRDMEHDIIEARNTVAVLSLSANAVTMEKFPFVFRFTTTYRLEGKAIRHEILVENEGTWDMPFALGFHPGFMCPFDSSHTAQDYEFRFNIPQSPIEIDTSEGGLVNGKEKVMFENKSAIQLTDTLFANDSYCMKNLTASTLSIVEKDTGRSVDVGLEGFPYTLIWSAAGPVKFVCIEPWHGLPDRTDTSGEWSEKTDTVVLEPQGAWSTALCMEFNR